ncbi:unnamed protein product [Sphenostylis stenocarpa]|uniref:Demeter RRM-fold domain-containing protein n=1 Tax=Sphenostylis stenocarpa TaxID=92480 RepID=A0AA86SKN5_9FABA|nr:unnamed protein product [Sphenostylis stenocarpa]
MEEATRTTPDLALPDSTPFIYEPKICDPIIELPASPSASPPASPRGYDVNNDEEFCNDIEDMPLCTHNEEPDYSPESTAIVVFNANTNIPLPKMKDVSRLKTERLVYVLPDKHPLLSECTPREVDDPSPYLLIVWTKGELENSCESNVEKEEVEENRLTVPGTLSIPCRTAMRGRFPLNGTYFQVNEVFVDYASMIHPMNVPRKWLWNLEKRIVYIGTTVSSIMRGK